MSSSQRLAVVQGRGFWIKLFERQTEGIQGLQLLDYLEDVME